MKNSKLADLVGVCCVVAVVACLALGLYGLQRDDSGRNSATRLAPNTTWNHQGKKVPEVTFVMFGGMTITSPDRGANVSVMCLRQGEPDTCFAHVWSTESDCLRAMEGVNYALTIWGDRKLINRVNPSLGCEIEVPPGVQVAHELTDLGVLRSAEGRTAMFCQQADDENTCFAREWWSHSDCLRVIEGINYALEVWRHRNMIAARQRLACLPVWDVPAGVHIVVDSDRSATVHKTLTLRL